MATLLTMAACEDGVLGDGGAGPHHGPASPAPSAVAPTASDGGAISASNGRTEDGGVAARPFGALEDVSTALRATPPLDFFVQDVCIDASGQVVAGAGPLDARCVSHRDLAVGERLPYHKVEYPGKTFLATVPLDFADARWRKVTRFDNIPVRTIAAVGGVGAITVGDNVDAQGAFWTTPTSADTIHGPDVVSTKTVWRGFAIDHSGPYRNVSTACTGTTTDALAPLDGNPQAILEQGRFSGKTHGVFKKQPTAYVNAREACPGFGAARGNNLEWRVEYMQFATGLAYPQEVTPPLLTLFVTNQTDVDDSHVEPTFNTREHGQVMHQSWDNVGHPEWTAHKNELFADEKKIREEHLCDAPPPRPPFDLTGWTQKKTATGEPMNDWVAPDGKNEWVLVSCRLVTGIAPSHGGGAGDDPKVWQDALASYELSASLVGAPLPPQPKLESISPTSGAIGAQVELRGTRFAAAGNRVSFGERGCTVKDVASSPTNDPNVRLARVLVPECAKDKGGAAVPVQIFNGAAMSVEPHTFDAR